MKLLTKELEAEFKRTGLQEETKDPIVMAKFFNPTRSGIWYATEYNPEEKIFFGYVSIFGDECDEWGNFSLEEIENFKGKFGLGIERDPYFAPGPISKVCPKAYKLIN